MTGAFESQIAELVRRGMKLPEAIRWFEKQFIAVALKEHRGNRSLAARKLGIHRNTLINKVKSLDLQAPR